MKRFFSLAFLLITFFTGFSQSKLYIRGDTINLKRDGGKANVVIDSNALIRKYLQIGGSQNLATTYQNNSHIVIGDSATTKGLIIPRVQTTAAITLPKQGMIVYSISDSAFYVRRPNNWLKIESGEGAKEIEENVAALRAAPVAGREGIILQGLDNAFDGNGGEYYWESGSVAVDDGITVIRPTAYIEGAWLKVFKGRTRTAEFNIKGSAGSQTTKLLAMIANATVREIILDEPGALVAFNGKINFNGKTVTIRNGAQFVSDGGTNDTLYNALIDADPQRKTFGTTLQVTGLKNSIIEAGWFGIVNDDVYLGPTPTNNYDLLIKAINAGESRNINIPGGTALGTEGYWYSVGSSIVIDRGVKISGNGVLHFPGSIGIKFAFGSRGSQIHGLTIRGNYAGTSYGYNSATQHGIEVNDKITIEKVSVIAFSGDNIRVFADVTGSPYTNANNTIIKDCYLYGAGRNNLSFRGGDANNCSIENVDATGAAKFNIVDSSYLGNYFQACHVASAAIIHPLNKSVVYHSPGGYYISVAPSGPATTIIEPEVTSGWQNYWLNFAFVPSFYTTWVNSVNFEVGCVGYYLVGGNQFGKVETCYAEQDGIIVTNLSNSQVDGGFAAGLGSSPGSIANVSGYITTYKIKTYDEILAGTQIGIGTAGTSPIIQLEVKKDQNNTTGIYVHNGTIGASSTASVLVGSANTFVESGYKYGGLGYFNYAGSAGAEAVRVDGMLFYNANNVTTGGISVATYAASPIEFYTAGIATANKRMSIDGSGNVIVNSLVGATTRMVTTTSTGQLGVSPVQWITSGSDVYYSAGNVGVGGSVINAGSYGRALTVVSPSSYAGIEIAGSAPSTDNSVGGFEFVNVSGGNNRLAIIGVSNAGATNSAYMSIYTNNAGSIGERLRINADGSTKLFNIPAATTDVDKFIVSDAGVIKFRTGTEMLSDIGAASLASPTFTGTPAAPTAAPGTSTTQIATTAFVTTAIAANISSGSYTPSLFNTTNVSASTAYTCYWYRVNDMVYVFGKVDIDPTVTLTATELGFSLPTGANASNLSDDGELAGTSASAIAAEAIAILGDAANDRAAIKYLCTDVTNHTIRIHFSYKVTPP